MLVKLKLNNASRKLLTSALDHPTISFVVETRSGQIPI